MPVLTDLCDWKCSYAAGNHFMQVWTNLCNRKLFLFLLELILYDFAHICATGNALMLLDTILCKFGRICAAGTSFVGTTVPRNSILNFPAKIWAEICRALHGDDSSHSQSQSGKRLLLASRGHPARSLAYQGSCIDPTHQPNTLDPTPDPPIL